MNECLLKQLLFQLPFELPAYTKATTQKLAGGRQHLAVKVQLDSGMTFVIKELNFNCYFGEYSIKHFNACEAYAAYVDRHIGSTVSAYQAGTEYVLEADNKFYLIYPWCEGIVKHKLVNQQANALGRYLAKLHALPAIKLPLKAIPFSPFQSHLWPNLIRLHLISNNELAQLVALSKCCEKSRLKYQGRRLLSHRDFNLENILWGANNTFHLIDWESSGYIAPLVDLIGLAFNIGGIGKAELEMGLVKGTIDAYLNYTKIPDKMTKEVFYQCYASWFAWLDYCLMNLDKSPNLYTKEIDLTLKSINLLHTYQDDIIHYF